MYHLAMVDDDDIETQMVARAIQLRQGLKLERFETAEDAEKLWKNAGSAETSHDLILIDLEMPIINGYEMVRLIREAPYPVRPLLVAYSGTLDGIPPAKLADFDYAFEKPIRLRDLDKLIERFSDLIAQHRLSMAG